MDIHEIRDRLKEISIEVERAMDLISIVITEVFDECHGSDGDYYGKLFPYEHSFESVLISSLDLLNNQNSKLSDIQNQLSQSLEEIGHKEKRD